jgi:hypothetical protein
VTKFDSSVDNDTGGPTCGGAQTGPSENPVHNEKTLQRLVRDTISAIYILEL